MEDKYVRLANEAAKRLENWKIKKSDIKHGSDIDIVSCLCAEHELRRKDFELVCAGNKMVSCNIPAWVHRKSLSPQQLEELKFLLINCPPFIFGVSLADILEHADENNDYVQLRDQELLKCFAGLLIGKGAVRRR